MELNQLALADFLHQFSARFFINQLLTIIVLFLFGLFLIMCIRKDCKDIWTLLLAYPLGLAVYVLTCFLLLLCGIPLRTESILLTLLCVSAALFIWKKPVPSVKQELLYFKQSCTEHAWKRWTFGIAALCVLGLAALAVSGILSVSLSNDSMYYYSLYSRALVKYGAYRREFNVFLTDVGQGTALIGTLPFFFGFNETFGIQQFFHINFLCIFTYAVYEQAAKAGMQKKQAVLTAGLSLLVMQSSMPFIIVSKWVMANVYFMEYLFISCYLAFRFENEKERILLIQGALMAVLSLLRMEGTVFVLFAVLCISVLHYKNRELACCFLLPSVILQIFYDIRIFLTMEISAPYTFLTEKKALVQLAGMAAVLCYLLFIRGRYFKKLQAHMNYLVIAGLLLINLGLCALDYHIYFGNLQAFGANLFNQSGWGLFPGLVIAMLILLPKKGYSLSFTELLWIGYLLITLAVCWARDGVLREGVGDSGNRVLLQIVPLVVYAFTIRVIQWLVPLQSKREQ